MTSLSKQDSGIMLREPLTREPPTRKPRAFEPGHSGGGTGASPAGREGTPDLRHPDGQAAPIGFLVKTFPKVSETFILGEILGLEQRGVGLHIISLRQPTDQVFHAANAEVSSPLSYVPGQDPAGLLRALIAHGGLLLRRPLRYLRTAAGVAFRAEGERLRQFYAAGCLVPILRKAGISHLHAHFASEPAGVAEIASALGDVTFSISAHAKDIYLSDPEVLKRKIRKARFTVTCTEYNRAYLSDLAGPAVAVHRMYHGVDLEKFHPDREPKDPDESPKTPMILSVGRLREKKGYPVLIEACRRLRDSGVAVNCKIVGYGPDHDRLAEQIRQADLCKSVELLGKLTHEEIIPLYREAAVFVMPCTIGADGDRDGVPNTILEAMAMELPVVCSDISGIPEVVANERNGLLVPQGGAAALSEALRDLIGDRPKRARLGAEARRTIARMFSSEKNLDQLVQLLAHATAGPDRTARRVTKENRTMADRNQQEVCYILMGYPRLSETFISNEIHLLETMGVKLRLFAIKHGGESKVNSVIAKIKVQPHYLPSVTSISQTKLIPWLRTNLHKFTDTHFRLIRRRPITYLATFCMAIGMCWRYRPKTFGKPKKAYLKEFLQAGHIAEEILATGGVGHLHGHFCHGVTNVTWFASRLTGIPFSFTAHAKDIYQPKLNPKDLLPRKLKAARFVATCTAANQAHLEQLLPDCSTVHTIYHGLDTDYFAPTDRGIRKTDKPVILSVGRFVEKKGFHYLVEACAHLHHRGVPFECRIVGERGDKRDDRYDVIKEMIEANGLRESVILQGAVTQDALKEIYQQSSLFVLPCQVTGNGDRDGIPNVLVEAMAMGVPIVSTPISGIPELVDDGVNGVLVPEGNALALANTIERLLGDSDYRREIAEAGRYKVCREFNSHETTRALKALFVESIATREMTASAQAAPSRGHPVDDLTFGR